MATKTCLICEADVPAYTWNKYGPGARIDCSRCGLFRASERLAQKIYEWRNHPSGRPEIDERKLAAASGAIRELTERGREEVWVEDLDDLLIMVSAPRDPLEAIDKLLVFIFNRTKTAGESVELMPARDRAVAYASTDVEFEYLRAQAEGLGFLDSTSETAWRLTLDGWRRIRELQELIRRVDQAFVAMWFNEELNEAWDYGFKLGIEDAGNRAMRIDLAEHNDKIDDLIIAEIRRSGLVVADFTGHRQSVYFEAGFAYGLGVPVIWTCRADWIDEAHFDTRQYNHIVWETSEQLRSRLAARIEATVPLRPRTGS